MKTKDTTNFFNFEDALKRKLNLDSLHRLFFINLFAIVSTILLIWVMSGLIGNRSQEVLNMQKRSHTFIKFRMRSIQGYSILLSKVALKKKLIYEDR